jgi:glycosyltransferase involved in cell wall biosynthesis
VILIPARNEAPRVGSVVRAAVSQCPDEEVVVVANGCTDATAEVALAAGATVIESDPGYGQALLAGYRYAAARDDLSCLIQLDADGQHPVDAIPAMRNALEHADLVIASRLAPGGAAPGWPRSRRWAIALMGWYTSILTGVRLRDVSSGFQAMRADVVRSLMNDFPVDHTDANVLVRLHRQGFRIKEVPVCMAPRTGGMSMHGGFGSVVYAGQTLVAAAKECRRQV